jgi:transcriptional regulator with XRE-family HTH domain
MTMTVRVGRCRLKTILKLKKMTQTELSKRSGLSVQRINDFANDRTMMSLTNAIRIAIALDVSVLDLYELFYM